MNGSFELRDSQMINEIAFQRSCCTGGEITISEARAAKRTQWTINNQQEKGKTEYFQYS